MEKNEVMNFLLVLGYSLGIFAWLHMYITWLMAFLNGGHITININNFNEAMLEFVILPTATVLIFIPFVYNLKISQLKKKLQDPAPNKQRLYWVYAAVGIIPGMCFTELILLFFKFPEFYLFNVHIHHLYVGIFLALVLSIIYFKSEKLPWKTSLRTKRILATFIGFALGIALHDFYFDFILGNFSFFQEIKITEEWVIRIFLLSKLSR
ncbi:MAG: hypothetical protein ACTSO9_06870 [Candidatus Helarchaeota archaeon]